MGVSTGGIVMRRAKLLLAQVVLVLAALPWSAAMPVYASCSDVWTGTQTDSATVSGTGRTFKSTVNYQLKYNTCNLGVYTQIKVLSWTTKYTITSNPLHVYYMTTVGKVLADCTGHADSGCLVYPGTAVYTDNRDFLMTTQTGTLTRSVTIPSPGAIYAYSRTTAIWDFLTTADGAPYWRFAYQFRRGVVYHDAF
jgi:hypothetical protein